MKRYGKRKRKIRMCVLAVTAFLFMGCGAEDNRNSGEETAAEASRDLFAMDTYMTVTAYGSNAQTAVDKAAEEIQRLNQILSTGDSGSEIYQINQNGKGVLSDDAAYLVERSLELYESTNGVFDIAIYPIMEAWGFTDDNFKVPSEDELEPLLELTDAGGILFDSISGEISFPMEDMKIDLGGIAKGYTSGRIMDIFRECGIESGLVNLGGNVQAFGTKPDGSQWRIAVQDPENANGYMGILTVENLAVITSGGYERCFEEDGVIYHHIINPDTGYPANNGLISSTIISADGTLADGLSTSMFIMGLEDASEYWRAHSNEFDMILMTDDQKLYVTEGIKDSFTSDYEITVITRDE